MNNKVAIKIPQGIIDKAKNNPEGVEAKSIQVLQNSAEMVVVDEYTDVQSTITV